ncbi:MAG: DEAD/DEAH box helicase [Gammaproteobacteria bacterium]|nr:DEAD/DEAH box helicase [Gammaproteobacteria bacterium]
MNFAQLGLSDELLRAISDKGYNTPSPVQQQAIPAILDKRDVMAAAQTGTGKTAGFTLPILQRLSGERKLKANTVRALVLTPTRELAAQVAESVATYGKYLPLRSAVVFGGVKINPQMMKLRPGVDVLVATPGRLMDLYEQNAVKFTQLEILVLDEADRMLDMGFIRDVKKILALLPKQRQNLLFSATFSNEIRSLAEGLLHNPVQIEASPRNAAAKTVEQSIYEVDQKRKPALLSHLIKRENWQQVLVFTRTKRGANKLSEQLVTDGITAAAIHGNKSQGARTKALAQFKAGDVRVLVATDIAARGIDIDQLPHVVNFDLPNVPADYVHRIGRTGRAGADGAAISLVSADEAVLLRDIETLIQQRLPRKTEPNFVPTQTVPATAPRPGGPKKPKKPKVKKEFDGNQATNKPRKPNPGNKPAGPAKSGSEHYKKRSPAKPGNGKPAARRPANKPRPKPSQG